MRYYFLLLLFLFFNALSLHSDDSVLTDDQENWSTMIDELHQSLMENTTKTLIKIRENADNRIAVLAKICEDAEKRNSELDFLLWKQPDDAILGNSISVYNKQIYDLNSFLNANLFQVKIGRSTLESEINRYNKLRIILGKTDQKYFTPRQLIEKEASLKK